MADKDTIARAIQEKIAGKNPQTEAGKNLEYAGQVSGNVSAALEKLSLDDKSSDLDKAQQKLLKQMLDKLAKIAESDQDTGRERKEIRIYLAKLTASAEIRVEKLEKEVSLKEIEISKKEEELKKEIEEKKLTEEEVKKKQEEIEKIKEEKKLIEEEKKKQETLAEDLRKSDPGKGKTSISGKENVQNMLKGDIQKIFPGLSMQQEEGESFGGMLSRQAKSLLSPKGIFDAMFGKADIGQQEGSFDSLVEKQKEAARIREMAAPGDKPSSGDTGTTDDTEAATVTSPTDETSPTSADVTASTTSSSETLTKEEREHLSKNLGFSEETIKKIAELKESKTSKNVSDSKESKTSSDEGTAKTSVEEDDKGVNKPQQMDMFQSQEQTDMFDAGISPTESTSLQEQFKNLEDVTREKRSDTIINSEQMDMFSGGTATKPTEILNTAISEGKIEMSRTSSDETTSTTETIEAKLEQQLDVMKTIADALLGVEKKADTQISLFEQQTELLQTQTDLQKEKDAEADRADAVGTAKEAGITTAGGKATIPEDISGKPEVVEPKIEDPTSNGAPEGGNEGSGGGGLMDLASNFLGGKGKGKGKLGKMAKNLLSKGKLGKTASKLGGKLMGGGLGKMLSKGLGKGLGKGLLKGAGKSLLKKIPGVGLVAGLGFGASRLMSGDWKGALGEVASGAASTIPGVGTAASMAIDAGMAARDATMPTTPDVGADTNTGETLEGMTDNAAPPAMPPVAASPTNVTNNISTPASGGSGANAPPASVRHTENSFIRFQDKRVSRV